MSATVHSPALSRNPFAAADAPTLAVVLAHLDGLDPARQPGLADLRSAVRTVARVLALPPEAIPAHPGFLRPRLERVMPAAHGLRPARWTNVRSLLGKALRLAGVDLLPGRYLAPLAPAWQQLADPLPKELEVALSRLMRFCSVDGIAPVAVDDVVLDRFLTALEQESLIRDPQGAHRGAIRAWNKAVAAVPGWPTTLLTMPSSRRRMPYVLPLAQFPASFQADLAGWLDRLAGTDPLGELPFRPVRASTVDRRKLQVLQLASALVRRGRNPGELHGLAALITPENLREALRFFLERAGNRSTRQIHALAAAALAIARHWVRVDDAQEQTLRGLARRCDPGAGGMTAKNRAVLRQLEDQERVHKLLVLPDRLARGLVRKPVLTRPEALRLQTALAIAILIAAPIRISNLVAIEVDRHLLHLGQGADRRVHLRLPAAEVKNGQELEHALPVWVIALLDLYLARALPLLQPAPGPWLFPGRTAGAKSRHSLGQQIGNATARALGVRLSPHQFRHACGAIFLGSDPGGHETVRNLLGHRSIETTIRYYAGMETAAALRRYDQVILGLRQDPPADRP